MAVSSTGNEGTMPPPQNEENARKREGESQPPPSSPPFSSARRFPEDIIAKYRHHLDNAGGGSSASSSPNTGSGNHSGATPSPHSGIDGWSAILFQTPAQLQYKLDISLQESVELQEAVGAVFLRKCFPLQLKATTSNQKRDALKEETPVEPQKTTEQQEQHTEDGEGEGTDDEDATVLHDSFATKLASTRVSRTNTPQLMVAAGTGRTPASLSSQQQQQQQKPSLGFVEPASFCSSAAAHPVSQGGRLYLPTGSAPLDATLLGGISVGFLTEVAGGPGSGKTLFCMKLAANTILQGLNLHALIGPERQVMACFGNTAAAAAAVGMEKSGDEEEDRLHGLAQKKKKREESTGHYQNAASSPAASAVGHSVLWIDADQRFSPSTFTAVLKQELKKQLEALVEKSVPISKAHAATASASASSLLPSESELDCDIVPVLLEKLTVVQERGFSGGAGGRRHQFDTLEHFMANRALLELQLCHRDAGLLVVDSFATLVRRSFSGAREELAARHEVVGSCCGMLKRWCEVLQLAVVLTNHTTNHTGGGGVGQQATQKDRDQGDDVAAGTAVSFGNTFYHSVNTRMTLTELDLGAQWRHNVQQAMELQQLFGSLPTAGGGGAVGGGGGGGSYSAAAMAGATKYAWQVKCLTITKSPVAPITSFLMHCCSSTSHRQAKKKKTQTPAIGPVAFSSGWLHKAQKKDAVNVEIDEVRQTGDWAQ